MPFTRRDEPISPRTWAWLGAPADPSRLPEVEVDEQRQSRPAQSPIDEVLSRRRDRGPAKIKVEVPGTLRTGRWVPPRRAGIGLLAVALALASILGIRVAWAKANDEPMLLSGATSTADDQAPRPGVSSSDGVTRGAGGPGGMNTAGSSVPGIDGVGTGAVGVVVVHVVGAVVKPGLVELKAGSRVADAITAAGGSTPEAELASINVARLLIDGEQIRVPMPGEIVESVGSGSSSGGMGAGATGVGAGGGSGGGSGRLVSLNTGDLAAFDSLPGVGPVLAQRIIDWRTAHGQFRSIDELGEVSGIGAKLLAQLTPLVTL